MGVGQPNVSPARQVHRVETIKRWVGGQHEQQYHKFLERELWKRLHGWGSLLLQSPAHSKKAPSSRKSDLCGGDSAELMGREAKLSQPSPLEIAWYLRSPHSYGWVVTFPLATEVFVKRSARGYH